MSSRQQTRTQQPHSAEIRQVYERVLAGASVRSRHVEVAGGRVHLLEHGAGPPVVLLHGTGNPAGFLLPLLQRAPRGPRDRPRPARGGPERPDRPPTGPLPREPRSPGWTGCSTPSSWTPPRCSATPGAGCGRCGTRWPTRTGSSGWCCSGVPTLPKTRCPLPIRLVGTPGLGQLLSRLVPPSPKSVLRLASAVGEKGRSPVTRIWSTCWWPPAGTRSPTAPPWQSSAR